MKRQWKRGVICRRLFKTQKNKLKKSHKAI